MSFGRKKADAEGNAAQLKVAKISLWGGIITAVLAGGFSVTVALINQGSGAGASGGPNGSPVGTPDGDAWLYDWVNAAGDNVTLCGRDWPAGAMVEFRWVGYDADGVELGSLEFEDRPSERTDRDGAFISVSEGTPAPRDLPPNTASLRAYAVTGDGEVEALTGRSLPYGDGRVLLDENHSSTCPENW
jgi:hypothetical protein